MANEKITPYFNTETLFSVLTHYDYTDEFEEFLTSRGKRVIMIHYGYFNEFDLVVYDNKEA